MKTLIFGAPPDRSAGAASWDQRKDGRVEPAFQTLAPLTVVPDLGSLIRSLNRLLDPFAAGLLGGGHQPSPRIDRCDRFYERGQLRLAVMVCDLLPDFVGSRVGTVSNSGYGFGQRQPGALGIAEVRCFPPCGDGKDPLGRLAGVHKLARVHVQAHTAAVDLARAHVHEQVRGLGNSGLAHGRTKLLQGLKRSELA